jgi:hypothetical protein
MYIEFDLLDRDYSYARECIEYAMEQWYKQYNIRHRIKPIKLKLRITFDHDESYTFWAMTWNPQQHVILAQYRIVSDLNNKI